MLKQRASLLEKLLFTSTKPDENEHRCVVAIDKNKAVSYFHGEHSQLKLEDPVMLYNVLDPMVQYESTVESFSERHDIIVFKLTEGIFENFPSNAKTLCYRDKYFQVGLNSRREPIWNEGIVTEQKIGHYCTGASHGHTGDLGSGIFNSLDIYLESPPLKSVSRAPKASRMEKSRTTKTPGSSVQKLSLLLRKRTRVRMKMMNTSQLRSATWERKMKMIKLVIFQLENLLITN
ncbi:hypothetical protein B9Z55_009772 [Caenorhabditis nigoni]|nr:hypothetical protein B9Z55_009772 [Caenorhabditis nigoni]